MTNEERWLRCYYEIPYDIKIPDNLVTLITDWVKENEGRAEPDITSPPYGTKVVRGSIFYHIGFTGFTGLPLLQVLNQATKKIMTRAEFEEANAYWLPSLRYLAKPETDVDFSAQLGRVVEAMIEVRKQVQACDAMVKLGPAWRDQMLQGMVMSLEGTFYG